MNISKTIRGGFRSLMVSVSLGVALAAMGGCASTASGSANKDPWEPFNRKVYVFNDTVDRAVLKPVAQGYDKVVPDAFKFIIRNMLANVNDVWIAANNLLQAKPVDALSDVGRVVVNTIFGLGGIGDVASAIGLEKHDEDFGQTLGKWGVASGPFLEIPFLGPSTVRDGIGTGVYYWQQPLNYMHDAAWKNSINVVRVVDGRAQLLQAEGVVNGVALDRYSFIRDAYLQRRRSQVYDGNPPPDADDDDSGYERPKDRKSSSTSPDGSGGVAKPDAKVGGDQSPGSK